MTDHVCCYIIIQDLVLRKYITKIFQNLYEYSMAQSKSKTPAAPPLFADAKTAWVLTDGTKGMEVQSMGLAQRMELAVTRIEIKPKGIVRNMPRLAGYMPMPAALKSAAKSGWPDVIITTGRRMAGLSILARTKSRGKSKTIHIQDSKLPPALFDLVIVPSHDKLRGSNVMVTTGSLNAIDGDAITASAAGLADPVRKLKKPLVAFLVGGSNRRYNVDYHHYVALGEYAAGLGHATDSGLVFIPSRRSLAEAARGIRKGIENAWGDPEFWIWDGTGANPYPGILDMADIIVVTSDSVNMTCEACFTGKAVYSYDFKPETGRIALFHMIMQEGGYTRSTALLTPYNFMSDTGKTLDETGRIADILTGRK